MGTQEEETDLVTLNTLLVEEHGVVEAVRG